MKSERRQSLICRGLQLHQLGNVTFSTPACGRTPVRPRSQPMPASALHPVRTALAATLVAAPALVIAAEPRSLLSEDMLSWYREDGSCEGRAYVSIQNALEMEAGAAQAAVRRRLSDAEPLAARLVADYDRVARVAAARGCPDIARSFWTAILDDYKGPAYEAVRGRAEAGIRALNTTSPR